MTVNPSQGYFRWEMRAPDKELVRMWCELFGFEIYMTDISMNAKCKGVRNFKVISLEIGLQ